MKLGCAMILLLLFTFPLGEAARVFGFKPFYLNSDSQVKAVPASTYPSVEDTIPGKALMAQNKIYSRRASLDEHPGSEANLQPNVSAKSKASSQRSNELPSVKFDVVEPKMEKTVATFQALGHSPGIGHDEPPGFRH